jgi:hypothetical protein
VGSGRNGVTDDICKTAFCKDLTFMCRKNESYATETGEIVRRETRMHKWGLPLAWVVGVGVSAPAGALASMWAGTCAAWHEYGQGRDSSRTRRIVSLKNLLVMKLQ